MIKVFERKTAKGQLIEGFALYKSGFSLQINLDGKVRTVGTPGDLPSLPASHKFAKGYADLKNKGFTKILKDTPLLAAEIESWETLRAQVTQDALDANPELKMQALIAQRELLANSLAGAIDEQISRQEKHYNNEYKSSIAFDSALLDKLVQQAEAELQEFDHAHPEVITKIKADRKAETERFLAYD